MKCCPGTFFSLALGLATLGATLAQCGERPAATPGPAAATTATTGARSAAAAASLAQDPTRSQPPPDQLRLLISGAMLGRLEPCGCASGQLGGLARRMQHIGERRNYDLLLEGGNLVEHATELDVLKLYTANTVLFGMANRYDALGVGANDLLLPRDEWNAFLGGTPEAPGTPVVASNLASSDPAWPGKPFVEKTVRGVKVRVASFLLALPEALRGPDAPVKLVPNADAWQAALAGADAETRRIVLVHGGDLEIRALIPTLQPPPDLVVGVDPGYVEPTPAAIPVGGVPLVFSGIRGRVLLEVSLHRDAKGPRAFCELVPLPASKTAPGGGGDPAVREVILQHRDEVAKDDVLGKMARQLPTPNGAAYMGNESCKPCHEAAFTKWKTTKHANAWHTLVEAEKNPQRYGWPVTKYPDCVGCHVVGHREQSGFLSHEDTPHLEDVGCERCHGPGSAHIEAQGKAKLGIIGGIAPSLLCIQCHDFEQSPNFVYGDKWPLIQHGR